MSLVPRIVLLNLGYYGTAILPLVVAATGNEFDFTDRQLAVLASLDVGGIVAGSITAVFLIKRVSWLRLVTIALCLIVGFNLICLDAHSFEALYLSRFGLEWGSGLIVALSVIALGETHSPDRSFAYATALLMFTSFLNFVLLPGFVERHGAAAIYVTHIGLTVLTLPFVFWFPRQAASRPLPTTPAQRFPKHLIVALAAFMVFSMGESGLWAFSVRMGDAVGLSVQSVGNIMAAAMVTSFVGALTAAWVSTRWGRTLPIALALTGFILGFLVFLFGASPSYTVGMTLTQFCYSFSTPYLLLFCVKFDESGRYAALVPAVQMIGFSAGPAITAPFLTGHGYAPIIWVGIISLLVCLLMVVPLARRLDSDAMA